MVSATFKSHVLRVQLMTILKDEGDVMNCHRNSWKTGGLFGILARYSENGVYIWICLSEKLRLMLRVHLQIVIVVVVVVVLNH